MTTAEAAALLGCAERHARSLCARGRLRARRVAVLSADGTAVRFKWDVDPKSVRDYARQVRPGWPRGKPRKERSDAEGKD